MTAIMPFKVIQGHQFRYECEARMRFTTVNSSYAPFLRYGGLLVQFSLSTGVPLFNALARGTPKFWIGTLGM